VLCLVTACNQDSSTGSAATHPDKTPLHEYVALGDSYSAGPLIANTETTTGCFRSDHNYPHLLASALHIRTLTDVTCSGADTTDLTGRQSTVGSTEVPPQLDAVTATTDLVTLGIGGNDFNLFASQLGYGASAFDPAVIPKIGDRVARALAAIKHKAPSARVFLIGYPRAIDPGTTCPGRLPLDAAGVRRAYAVQLQLTGALRSAAKRTHTRFIDMFKASKGHGICSRHAWVNGRRNRPGLAAPFHPFVEEMRAVSRQLAAALKDER
jgi:lysophospholipase L1-like esterase